MTLTRQRHEYCEHSEDIQCTGSMRLENDYMVIFYECSICHKIFEEIEFMG